MVPNDPYRGSHPKQHLPIHSAFTHDEQLMLAMRRGRYDANAYVFFAAVLQVALIGAVIGLPAYLLLTALGAEDGNATSLGVVLGGVVGIPGAIGTFWGRWARVEAYSSRFCSGVANLSMLYVPLIGLVYANVVLVQDLLRRT